MTCYEYKSLLQILQENKGNENNIEDIKTQYIQLLTQLTDTNIVTNEEFINRIIEISNIGIIIICYFVNVENKKICIVGSGTIIYEPKIIHNCKYVGHIEDIVVDNLYRSKGVAKTIINELINLAYKRNCYKVILDCKPNLQNFYEKIGFTNNGLQMSLYF